MSISSTLLFSQFYLRVNINFPTQHQNMLAVHYGQPQQNLWNVDRATVFIHNDHLEDRVWPILRCWSISINKTIDFNFDYLYSLSLTLMLWTVNHNPNPNMLIDWIIAPGKACSAPKSLLQVCHWTVQQLEQCLTKSVDCRAQNTLAPTELSRASKVTFDTDSNGDRNDTLTGSIATGNSCWANWTNIIVLPRGWMCPLTIFRICVTLGYCIVRQLKY